MTDSLRVDIEALAELARVSIPQNEKPALEKDVPAILGFVRKVQSVTVENTLPVAGAHRNVMRNDEPAHESGEYTEALLSAAPAREGGYLKVKQVITGGKHAAE